MASCEVPEMSQPGYSSSNPEKQWMNRVFRLSRVFSYSRTCRCSKGYCKWTAGGLSGDFRMSHESGGLHAARTSLHAGRLHGAGSSYEVAQPSYCRNHCMRLAYCSMRPAHTVRGLHATRSFTACDPHATTARYGRLFLPLP